MGSSRPWIDTARDLIKLSKEAEQPVLIDQAVKDILRRHPDCGIPEAELANMLLNLVVDERWSMIGDGPLPARDRPSAPFRHLGCWWFVAERGSANGNLYVAPPRARPLA